MIRILLVEDNEIVRELLGDMIMMQDDFEVIGAADNGLVALQLLKAGLKPNIVLADLNMPEMDGLEFTANLTTLYNSLKVIILTMHAKPAFLNRALAAGARGYLLKNGDMDQLFKAIRRVDAGELVVSDTND